MKTITKVNYGNVEEFYGDIGKNRHRLLELQGNNTEYEIEIVDYQQARELTGEEFIPQLYNLETQFPPGIAFMDGLMEENEVNYNEWELIRDLEEENALSRFVIAKFENENFIIGYALGNEVENELLRERNYNHYINSVVTDMNFRSVNRIGVDMVQPILDVFDSRGGNSYLTTWINTGSRISYPHIPPAPFWNRRGYRPIDIEEAENIIECIRGFQENHGVIGRNYDLETTLLREIRDYFREDIFPEMNPTENIPILRNYYEQTGFGRERWDGIIMVRNAGISYGKDEGPIGLWEFSTIEELRERYTREAIEDAHREAKNILCHTLDEDRFPYLKDMDGESRHLFSQELIRSLSPKEHILKEALKRNF